jgi:hypothetical protein
MFGHNMLLNPSFEEDTDGELAVWKKDSSGKYTINKNVKHHGKQSACYYNNNNPLYNGAVSQEITLNITTPTKLLISGWAKRENQTSAYGASLDFMIHAEIFSHSGTYY